jgi:hypothetical protein
VLPCWTDLISCDSAEEGEKLTMPGVNPTAREWTHMFVEMVTNLTLIPNLSCDKGDNM